YAIGLLGIIPGTFLYCSIGSLAKNIQDLKNVQIPNNLYMTIVGIISTFLVVYYSAKYSKEYFEKS
ncbi:TVP38/TMEM64 family protein, partial [Prochlorococcus sp. AH-736-P10]|nr:TVP38/TMEM64 family protein [Prochlorococcus sp. AH-736-P10]